MVSYTSMALNPSNSSNLEQLASKGLNLEQCQAAGLLTAHLQTQSTDSGGVTAYSLLLSTPPHSHWVLISPRAFAVPLVVEGVDLGTAVGVCSPFPGLCITVAYAINTQHNCPQRDSIHISHAPQSGRHLF